MSTKPTQSEHPWRATVRTVFAFVVALAAILPQVVEASGVDETIGWVAALLAVAGGITRIMAVPGVDDLLTRFVPWLAAAPRSVADPELPDHGDDVDPDDILAL